MRYSEIGSIQNTTDVREGWIYVNKDYIGNYTNMRCGYDPIRKQYVISGYSNNRQKYGVIAELPLSYYTYELALIGINQRVDSARDELVQRLNELEAEIKKVRSDLNAID